MVDQYVTVLEAEERYARERLQLYRARSYGPQPTNSTRLRGLARAADLAERRLSLAKSRSQQLP